MLFSLPQLHMWSLWGPQEHKEGTMAQATQQPPPEEGHPGRLSFNQCNITSVL